METTDATEALNVVLLSPAPILTPLGTITLVLLLWSATVTVFEAAAVSVTEQLAAPGELTVPGAHVIPLSCVAGVRLMVAC